MHVQNTAGGEKASKKKCNNSKFRICYQVESDYPKCKSRNKSVNDDCKYTFKDFKKLTELLIKDEKKEVECGESKPAKCKTSYRVCCQVKRRPAPVRISTTSLPYPQANPA
jgi:hypothetical protein